MNVIKRIPMPITGVALGCAALGNLLQSYSEALRNACGIFSAIFVVLFLLKVICCPKLCIEDMKNPIIASVSGTFSMTLMLLSTYVKPYIVQGAFYLWVFAIALHIALILYVTYMFILKFDLKKIFASFYIVYVGIVVGSVTAPAYEATQAGTIFFWFGFVTLLLLFIVVTARYLKLKEIPNPAKPIICIYAAPTSLCVAGYVQSVTPKSKEFLLAMLAVATVIYLFALFKAITFLKLPFYPSYAAFTFPFVISAIATKQTMACMANMGSPMPWLSTIVLIETVIAVTFVIYAYLRYVLFMVKGPAK